MELGCRPKSKEEEKKIIEDLIAPYESLHLFIRDKLEEIKEVYLVNTKFWNLWSRYTGFGGVKTEGVFHPERPSILSNAELMTWYTQSLKDEIEYGRDFMMLTEQLWNAFSRWYRGHELKRKVLRFDKNKLSHGRLKHLQKFPYYLKPNKELLVVEIHEIVIKT